MKAAIYNPYLDTLGGGERYSMAFAQAVVKAGYKVDVQWKKRSIKEKLEGRFGIKLEGVNFIKDIKRGDGYDICFWVSDGSIPLLRAHKNFLHFQFPFKDVNGRSLLNKMKLFRVEKIICNSYFTKEFIDGEYGVDSIVIYPPVDVNKFKPKRKENKIIFIGRFSQLMQAKNQHVLVQAFKRLFDSGYKGWRLILAGGIDVGVGDYLGKLKRLAQGYPIDIIESPKFSKLQETYGNAKIFWSAVGYGFEERKKPGRVEHFGIAVVEAMAAGCVPIVYASGGYKEIIEDGFNGFLWKKRSQLVKKTEKLISDSGLLRKLGRRVRLNSKVYEYERFEAEVLRIL